MKQLKCEMCGGTDLIKDGGVFICQTCGCKYTVEEAKRMLIEGTVEVAGTVKIDRSDNFKNLIQLARDAINDGRFDGAYNYCSEALMIDSSNPEIVELQGLAVLGKEDIVIDVPTSCVNAMKKMASLMANYKASFDQKRDVLNSLKKAVDVVVKLKKVLYDEQISNINSQKVAYSPSEEKNAQANVTLQALAGNVFTQQSAKTNLTKIQENRQHNEGLDVQISKIRIKVSKVTDFAAKFKKEIDSCLKTVNDEEREFKNNRRIAYWEEHKDEKEQLNSKLAQLNGELEPIQTNVMQIRNQINVIEKELRGMDLPSYKKKEQLLDQLRDLDRQRANLGIFKVKEKKQINEKIAKIHAQMPSINDIQREKDELREAKSPQIEALKAEERNLEKQASKLKELILEINSEFTKDR